MSHFKSLRPMWKPAGLDGPDGEFGAAPPTADGIVLEILAKDFRKRQEARNRELDAMISMGWGENDPGDIPVDWWLFEGPALNPEAIALRRFYQKQGRLSNRKRKIFSVLKVNKRQRYAG